MKKIPTLFERKYENGKMIEITNQVTFGMDWVLEGKGIATLKIDGSCCAIINGVFYKRYDAKRGKQPPKNAIVCCDPDEVTGHWPHWVPVDCNKTEDRWFCEAYQNSNGETLVDGTYEAIGPHFQSNPYCLERETLVKHGEVVLEVPRSWEGLREYLATHSIEGIVFWLDGEPKCKIRKKDFGFKWNGLRKPNIR